MEEDVRQMVAELASVVETLLTILLHKGELTEAQLQLIAKLRKHAKLITAPQIALDNTTDKYTIEGPPIDCDARMHLCQGRCCSYEVRLSQQDLEERALQWQIERPYFLARAPSGRCLYQDHDGGGCTSYQHRPAGCRRYDCREDARVWIDYEKMIPAPMPETLVSIRRR